MASRRSASRPTSPSSRRSRRSKPCSRAMVTSRCAFPSTRTRAGSSACVARSPTSPSISVRASTASICLRKHVINTMLDAAHLPVPRFGVARVGEPLPSVGFPAICKPAAEDASLGVEQRSVVRSARGLQTRVSEMHQEWDDVLVQRFIAGREVNVGILGDQVLPIAEIDFSSMPDAYWRIVSYRSKWQTGSDEDMGSVPCCPADLPDEVVDELGRIALAAWRVVGGRGYGRVDLRIDENMRPWILEVNANPDFAPTAGLARMARTAGIDYPSMVRLVCEQAFSQKIDSSDERWARKQRLSGVEAVG